MKKFIALVTILCAGAFAASGTSQSKDLFENTGSSIAIIGTSGTVKPKFGTAVVLDTLEEITSYDYYSLIGKTVGPVRDTIGYLGFECKDSTGTDTLAIRVYHQFNLLADGSGTWVNVDSTDLKDIATAALSGYTVKTDPVENVGGYQAVRFKAVNILLGNANRKSTCRNFVLNRHERTWPHK